MSLLTPFSLNFLVYLFCRNRSIMCYPFLLSECLSPLGLASGKLPDSALTASSEVRSWNDIRVWSVQLKVRRKLNVRLKVHHWKEQLQFHTRVLCNRDKGQKATLITAFHFSTWRFTLGMRKCYNWNATLRRSQKLVLLTKNQSSTGSKISSREIESIDHDSQW